MHFNTVDLSGKRYGRLRVIEYSHSYNTHAHWKCKCDCGVVKIITSATLRRGVSNSCGCISREKASKRFKAYANSDKHKNEGNPQWKGDKVSYGALHDWVKRRIKPSLICHHCKKKKKLDLANKNHREYRRNLTDWLWLCRKCHVKYDKE